MVQSTADNQVKLIGAVARTYAQSLMDLAQQQGVVDPVARELSDLADLLADQTELRAFFASPSIHAAKRAKSLQAIFEGRLSDLTYRFLQVVNRKGRLDQLGRIRVAYEQLLMDKRGQVEVDLYTAGEMPADRLRAVEQRIGEAIGREAIVHARVDPSLIGGMKLRIGDKLIDGSIATRLASLRRQLIDRGREAIRADAGTMLEEN